MSRCTKRPFVYTLVFAILLVVGLLCAGIYLRKRRRDETRAKAEAAKRECERVIRVTEAADLRLKQLNYELHFGATGKVRFEDEASKKKSSSQQRRRQCYQGGEPPSVECTHVSLLLGLRGHYG